MTEPTEKPTPAFAYVAEFMRKNEITKATFADKIGINIDQVTVVLKGSRIMSHEFAFAVEKAYPQLIALGLLYAQSKWRLHQLAHPELYRADEAPAAPSRKRTDIDEQKVCAMYAGNERMRKIALEFGISLGSIYKITDAAGIPRRGAGRKPAKSEPAA